LGKALQNTSNIPIDTTTSSHSWVSCTAACLAHLAAVIKQCFTYDRVQKTQVFLKKSPTEPGGLSGFIGFWVLLRFFGRAVPAAV